MDALDESRAAPAPEVAIDCLPGGIVAGQPPPATATAQHLEDGIENLPQAVAAGPPGVPGFGQQVFDLLPFAVVAVAGIDEFGNHPKRDAELP